jgi:hypothetical protein
MLGPVIEYLPSLIGVPGRSWGVGRCADPVSESNN